MYGPVFDGSGRRLLVVLDQHADLVAVRPAADQRLGGAQHDRGCPTLTAGAVNSTRFGSLASSATAGPATCVQEVVPPAAAVGHARTDTLPPSRTAWSARTSTPTGAVGSTALTVTDRLRGVPFGSRKSTLNP